MQTKVTTDLTFTEETEVITAVSVWWGLLTTLNQKALQEFALQKKKKNHLYVENEECYLTHKRWDGRPEFP